MTPKEQSASSRALCASVPVIPVLVVHDAGHAEPLARALVAGGLPVLEVTLRTPSAVEVIRRMAAVPGAQVGAGTVLTPDDAKRARDAGATFAVSPGLTEKLARGCGEVGLPLLPGVSTASEAMMGMELGFDMFKLFPAEAVGGAALLKALHGPLPSLSFCPTGGVRPDNMATYLSLPNVLCVGGTWIATEDLLAKGDWAGIEARARAAARRDA